MFLEKRKNAFGDTSIDDTKSTVSNTFSSALHASPDQRYELMAEAHE